MQASSEGLRSQAFRVLPSARRGLRLGLHVEALLFQAKSAAGVIHMDAWSGPSSRTQRYISCNNGNGDVTSFTVHSRFETHDII